MSAFRSVLLGWWLLLVALYTFTHPAASYLQVGHTNSEKGITPLSFSDYAAEECLIPRPYTNIGVDIKNLLYDIPYALGTEDVLHVKNIDLYYSNFLCSRSFNVIPTFSSFHAFW